MSSDDEAPLPLRTELTDVLLRTKDQLTESLDAGPTEQRDQPVGQLLGAPGAAIGKAGRDVVGGSRRVGGTASSRR